ncbi:PD-(D/E)XK nuclease-like domain-containing protein [Thiorhodococcus fuscus]|uniref:PD-(D/E)XK nuclease-like domain-containing protein n=1 Tax=Thiorhodococcus fuscus TaxID=527200 RepID=A0ABW4Y7N1_9GAMM
MNPDWSKPGIHHGVAFEDYLALRAVSAHGLMQIERSPAHYRTSIETPHAPSAAQALGTLTHLCVLEPEEYRQRVRVAPAVDRRTKAGKETFAAFEAEVTAIPDAMIATAEQDTKARAMRESVMAQPFARALLADGAAEVTLLWDQDGTFCKARPDWLCSGHEVIVDLKTAADASEQAFAKACGNYRYHLQAAWYQDAVMRVGLGDRVFVFIAVEPEPPYAAGLYQIDDQALRVGRIRYERALETYRECVATNDWPGYAREIRTIELPKWAL